MKWVLRVAGRLVLFVLALLSKESAFILVPLFALVALDLNFKQDWRKYAAHLLPYCALALVAMVSVALTRSHSFRFSDGSFSLHAPVWLTLPRNFFRVLWIWGVFSGALIFLTSAVVSLRRSAVFAFAWIAIALIPYSFLTYSPQIPSRQLYLASVGLSFLFGLGVACLRALLAGLSGRHHSRSGCTAALLVAVLAHNLGYIWIKKQPPIPPAWSRSQPRN